MIPSFRYIKEAMTEFDVLGRTMEAEMNELLTKAVLL
jgi:hypothetical protein